jgi:hypothetical protein
MEEMGAATGGDPWPHWEASLEHQGSEKRASIMWMEQGLKHQHKTPGRSFGILKRQAASKDKTWES